MFSGMIMLFVDFVIKGLVLDQIQLLPEISPHGQTFCGSVLILDILTLKTLVL